MRQTLQWIDWHTHLRHPHNRRHTHTQTHIHPITVNPLVLISLEYAGRGGMQPTARSPIPSKMNRRRKSDRSPDDRRRLEGSMIIKGNVVAESSPPKVGRLRLLLGALISTLLDPKRRILRLKTGDAENISSHLCRRCLCVGVCVSFAIYNVARQWFNYRIIFMHPLLPPFSEGPRRTGRCD